MINKVEMNNFLTVWFKFLFISTFFVSFGFIAEETLAEPFMFGVTIDNPWDPPGRD